MTLAILNNETQSKDVLMGGYSTVSGVDRGGPGPGCRN